MRERYFYNWEYDCFESETELYASWKQLCESGEIDCTFSEYLQDGDISEGGELEDVKTYANREIRKHESNIADLMQDMSEAKMRGDMEHIETLTNMVNCIRMAIDELRKYA